LVASKPIDPTRKSDSTVIAVVRTTTPAWRTVDGRSEEDWFDGEPTTGDGKRAMPTGTTREAITKSRSDDTVEKAILRARGLVDLQRRRDVDGDAEGLIDMLAAAWGMEREVFDPALASNLAPTGELLRYALGADKANPVAVLPVNVYQAVSVAGGTSVREQHGGSNAVMPWARIRASLTSSFVQSIYAERLKFGHMLVGQGPGDAYASLHDPRYLTFRPREASAWSCDPKTFSLSVAPASARSPDGQAPLLSATREAMEVLQEEMQDCIYRPVCEEARDVAVPRLVPMKVHGGEALAANLVRALSRVPAPEVKSYGPDRFMMGLAGNLFRRGDACLGVSLARACREVRLYSARDGLSQAKRVEVCKYFARKWKVAGANVALRAASEASKRGATLEEWWGKISNRLPQALRGRGDARDWVAALCYQLIVPHSEKWEKVAAYLSHQTMRREGQELTYRGVVPPGYGSPARVLAMGKALLYSRAELMAAKYEGVAAAAYALSSDMSRSSPLKRVLQDAANLWLFRSRVTKTAHIRYQTGEEVPDEYTRRGDVKTSEGVMTVLFGVQPKRAYQAVRQAFIKQTPVRAKKIRPSPAVASMVPMLLKASAPRTEARLEGTILRIFRKDFLEEKMEKNWDELWDDTYRELVRATMEGVQPRQPAPAAAAAPVVPAPAPAHADAVLVRAPRQNVEEATFVSRGTEGKFAVAQDYFSTLAMANELMGQEIALQLEDAVGELDESEQERIESLMYGSVSALMEEVYGTGDVDDYLEAADAAPAIK
jgi:hypothetical protein